MGRAIQHGKDGNKLPNVLGPPKVHTSTEDVVMICFTLQTESVHIFVATLAYSIPRTPHRRWLGYIRWVHHLLATHKGSLRLFHYPIAYSTSYSIVAHVALTSNQISTIHHHIYYFQSGYGRDKCKNLSP